jgi:hypothetical protein
MGLFAAESGFENGNGVKDYGYFSTGGIFGWPFWTMWEASIAHNSL